MVRPTDQEMIATEKIVCYSQFPRGGDTPHHERSQREAPGSVKRQKEQGEGVGKRLVSSFSGKGWVNQDELLISLQID